MKVAPRFCLQCGRKLERRRADGRTRLSCERCGWTYYGNPVPAAAAVLVRGKRVLLARRAGPPYEGTWDLPGGFLESGETPEVALRRELREELGVSIGALRLQGFYDDRYGAGGIPLLCIVYRARAPREPFTVGDDVSEVQWFPLDRLPLRQVGFASMRAALRDVARPPRKE